MGSEEYYAGRLMESNPFLHRKLVSILGYDDIFVDGSTGTKTDIIAVKNEVVHHNSIKNASGKNTQVHLTTLSKIAEVLSMPESIKNTLNMWLGTPDSNLFATWIENKNISSYEKNHNRLCSGNLENWQEVEDWFNKISSNQTLPKLLIQGLNVENPIKYLIWVNKKTKSFQVVDVNKLIEWIANDCNWITMPDQTVLRCVTPDYKPILWLQMKGNKDKKKGGYNHAPQFHIVEHWPKEFIVHEGSIVFN